MAVTELIFADCQSDIAGGQRERCHHSQTFAALL